MARWLRRTFLTLCLLLVSASVVAYAGWQMVVHKIAARERAPHFTSHLEPATDFSFRTLDGHEEHLAGYKGKVIFVDLWGTWCIQCVAEMPKVQTLYNHYRNDPDVQFLIISRLDSPSSVRAYANRHHFDLPFYVMRDDEIPKTMQLNQFPATFLYSKDGSMVYKHLGAADWSSPTAVSFVDSLRKQ